MRDVKLNAKGARKVARMLQSKDRETMLSRRYNARIAGRESREGEETRKIRDSDFPRALIIHSRAIRAARSRLKDYHLTSKHDLGVADASRERSGRNLRRGAEFARRTVNMIPRFGTLLLRMNGERP